MPHGMVPHLSFKSVQDVLVHASHLLYVVLYPFFESINIFTNLTFCRLTAQLKASASIRQKDCARLFHASADALVALDVDLAALFESVELSGTASF